MTEGDPHSWDKHSLILSEPANWSLELDKDFERIVRETSAITRMSQIPETVRAQLDRPSTPAGPLRRSLSMISIPIGYEEQKDSLPGNAHTDQ